MNPATSGTSKLAQTAKGTRRCEGCGRTKGLDKFPIHPRWKTPMKICDGCMRERRLAGAAKRVRNMAANRAKADKIEKRVAAKEQRKSVKVEVLFARLDGFALALAHDGLTDLISDLKREVGHVS